MKKNTKDKEDNNWWIEIGLYPGILFGIRTYYAEELIQYVFYLPFIDISIIKEL